MYFWFSFDIDPIMLFALDLVSLSMRIRFVISLVLNINCFPRPHFSIASGFGNIKYSTQADYCLGISKEINDEFIKACVEPEKVIYFPNPFSRMDIIKRKMTLQPLSSLADY